MSNSGNMKRAIIFDFHSKMYIEVVKELKNRSVDILYWTAHKRDFFEMDRSLFPGTIFHNLEDAVAGIGVREIEVKPVGRNLMKSLMEHDMQSLIMMEHVDRMEAPLMQKVHLYNTYVKYWWSVLTQLKPDVLLFSDVPHASFKYVAYQIARLLGIQCLNLKNMQIAGRIWLMDDMTDYTKLKNELAKNKKYDLKDLSPDIRDYYTKQKSQDRSPFFFRPEYMKERVSRLHDILPSIKAIVKNLKNGTIVTTTYRYVVSLFLKRSMPSIEPFRRSVFFLRLQEKRWHKIKQSFKQEYERYQVKPDYSKKYIYVTLHNQPEQTTTSSADIFVDQLLMVDILSSVIPSDWVMYVKENPLQWIMPRAHVGRFRGYAKEMAEKKNVFLMPTDTSTFELIKNAQAAATVTGTAALEAIFRGKPAMVFGNVWFMYCDGVFKIDDAESAEKAIEKIKEGFKPDEQKIINFLGAVDKTAVRGYQDSRFRDKDDMNIITIQTDKENIQSIADAFYQEIEA